MSSLFILPDNIRDTILIELNEQEIEAVFFAVSLAKTAAVTNPILNAGAKLWARNLDSLMKKSKNYRRLSVNIGLTMDSEVFELELTVYEVGYLTQTMMMAAELIKIYNKDQTESYDRFYQRLIIINQPYQNLFESIIKADKVKILNLVHKLRRTRGQTL